MVDMRNKPRRAGLASPTTVDAVVFDKQADLYRLILELDAPLDGGHKQLLALQEKLNNYVGFAQERMGELYPGAEGKDVVIRLVGLGTVALRTAAVLKKLQAAIEEQGLGFETDAVP